MESILDDNRQQPGWFRSEGREGWVGCRQQPTPCLVGCGACFTSHLGKMEPLDISAWRPGPICRPPCCSVKNRWGSEGKEGEEREHAEKWVGRLCNPRRVGRLGPGWCPPKKREPGSDADKCVVSSCHCLRGLSCIHFVKTSSSHSGRLGDLPKSSQVTPDGT